MKKDAALYPYNYLAAQLARYRDLLNYNITGIVAPKGLSMAGFDGSFFSDFGGTNITFG